VTLALDRNLAHSMAYQSYLQTTAPVEKYMFDKSNFKTLSVRTSNSSHCISISSICQIEILPKVQDFFKQPTGERDISNVDEVGNYLKIKVNQIMSREEIRGSIYILNFSFILLLITLNKPLSL
jgi:hypothetical protein